jgi:hypothetical protein
MVIISIITVKMFNLFSVRLAESAFDVVVAQ